MLAIVPIPLELPSMFMEDDEEIQSEIQSEILSDIELGEEEEMSELIPLLSTKW